MKIKIDWFNVLVVSMAILGFPVSFFLNLSENDNLNALAGILGLATWFAIAWTVTLIYRKVKRWLKAK